MFCWWFLPPPLESSACGIVSDELLRAVGAQSVYVLKQGGLVFDDIVVAAALWNASPAAVLNFAAVVWLQIPNWGFQ